MLEEILEKYPDETFLKADGLGKALLGVDEKSMRLIYSVEKSIKCFEDQGMTREEAIEWFFFNVEGAYVGEKTPIWCNDYM